MAKNNKKGGKINYKKQHKQQQKSNSERSEPVLKRQTGQADEVSVHFQPQDTWFFRESRPHDAAGASELSSLFPPSPRTLIGAFRTFVGDQMGIDWSQKEIPVSDFDFGAELGDADHLGQLQLQGPWIIREGQRLYPAPAYLIKKENQIQRLKIGSSVRCDLGTVRLPQMPEGCSGYKTLESYWLTGRGLRACLDGGTPDIKDLVALSDLIAYESRLGIARDNHRRTVHQGQLYQTRHLRLEETVGLELGIQHPRAENWFNQWGHQNTLIRLGGEGRMASLALQQERETLPFTQSKSVTTFALHFITPANFNGALFPADLSSQTREELTVWQGQLKGIPFAIESAVIGKVHREGGWDMQRHQPRAVKSYLPAGSVWFCRLAEPLSWSQLQDAFQGQCLGEDITFGRGQVLLGQWLD